MNNVSSKWFSFHPHARAKILAQRHTKKKHQKKRNRARFRSSDLALSTATLCLFMNVGVENKNF